MFSLGEIPFHILTNFSSSLSETNLQRKLKHSRAFIKVFSRAINSNITNLMESRIRKTHKVYSIVYYTVTHLDNAVSSDIYYIFVHIYRVYSK